MPHGLTNFDVITLFNAYEVLGSQTFRLTETLSESTENLSDTADARQPPLAAVAHKLAAEINTAC